MHYGFSEKKLFSDVNISINKGDFILVEGISGSGKTSLLRLISGFEKPQVGDIIFKDENIKNNKTYIHQIPQLIEASIRDNLLLPFTFKYHQSKQKPKDEDLKQWMMDFCIDAHLNDLAQNCSIGQQQRLCLIRAFLLKPPLMLLDEPTSALDSKNRKIIETYLEQVSQQGTTILMVNHSDYRPLNIPYKIFEVLDENIKERA